MATECPDYLTRDRVAVLAGLAAPLALAAVLMPFRASFPNTDAALAMLLVVVAVAANGDRLAGVLAAVSTAVWFDFFLTQPYERFTITRRTDIETTVLLLVIGVAVTEIAVWGRRQLRDREQAAPVTWTASTTRRGRWRPAAPRAALIDQVSGQLMQLLSLRSCRFQYGVAGLGRPARLHRDGSVTLGELRWDGGRRGVPAGYRRGVAGGRRRHLPGPVPDDPGARRAARAGTAAAGGRVRRSGRRRAGQQPSRRPKLTGALRTCWAARVRRAGNDIGAFPAEEGMPEVA